MRVITILLTCSLLIAWYSPFARLSELNKPDQLVDKIVATFDDGSWERGGLTATFRSIKSKKHNMCIEPGREVVYFGSNYVETSLTTHQKHLLFQAAENKIKEIDLKSLENIK